MDTQAYAVVWDGRKNGPGSAYLVAAPEAPAAPVAPKVTLSARVLALLRETPRTTAEIAVALGVSTSTAQSVVWLLRQAGRIVIAEHRPVTARAFGRRVEYVYGLAGEA